MFVDNSWLRFLNTKAGILFEPVALVGSRFMMNLEIAPAEIMGSQSLLSMGWEASGRGWRWFVKCRFELGFVWWRWNSIKVSNMVIQGWFAYVKTIVPDSIVRMGVKSLVILPYLYTKFHPIQGSRPTHDRGLRDEMCDMNL